MKILMVNGSPHEHGCTARAMAEMEAVFAAAGIEVEKMTLGRQQIRSCVACGGCRKTGRCVFSDAVNEFLDRRMRPTASSSVRPCIMRGSPAP